MLTNKTKLSVFVSTQADESRRISITSVTSENPAGRRCGGEGSWTKEDFTFSVMYYYVLLEWEWGP